MAELTLSAADIASGTQEEPRGVRTLARGQHGRSCRRSRRRHRCVSGLPDCAVNELLEFADGTVGLALNLDEDSIGAVVLGDADHIEEASR
ncbi:MAG: hypothetical protein R2715_20770 [Ilumatobacteraceae bacterium]